ncbi:hypothetical protein PS870_01737 [Pseudomonas fluorescens]|jgi:hypothetical protein|uniref:Uncharacterized protein n=1 Tax=Pseudomonas fluorescens TaxID=294 RepID=A0A5E7IVZ6_PSEFL|nr:hypothetical protein [Pseudomonas fluorescens]VVO79894.1 hypothetical protein PS870_01737 [Pseudomonas fluorescens]
MPAKLDRLERALSLPGSVDSANAVREALLDALEGVPENLKRSYSNIPFNEDLSEKSRIICERMLKQMRENYESTGEFGSIELLEDFYIIAEMEGE